MSIPPIRSVATTAPGAGLRGEFVYTQLRTEIVGRSLLPGERLREVDLAERLGVSRTPVREALKRHGQRFCRVVRQEGLEPPTPGLEGPCSIQLSYCRMRDHSTPIGGVTFADAWSVISMTAADILTDVAVITMPGALAPSSQYRKIVRS
jgi:DNA-binding transcriptional MocR family regulator